jgi:dipeptidyl aminopeptidase/acylaminoacyl peptidase
VSAEELLDRPYFADPLRVASYQPLRGQYVVFERGSGGDEASQLYRMDLATGRVTLLSNPDERHELQGWLHRTSALLYLSVPLDRTASGRSRSEISQTLSLVDPQQPSSRRRLAELPGGGWAVGGVSWDDTRIALTRYLSANESEVWLLDVASGNRQRLLPAAGEAPATHWAAVWKRDDSGFFVLSDRGGEFRELMFLRLADGRLTRITRHIPWDVEDVKLDASGKLLGVNVNVGGRKELRFFDGESFEELPTPRLPEGSVDTLAFHPRLPGLAVTLEDSRSPATVVVVDPATVAAQRWSTPAAPPGVDARSFGTQRIVSWPSFDGRQISAIVNAPPALQADAGPCSSTSTAVRGQAEDSASSAATTISWKARRRGDPAERARLVRLRQDLPLARRRREARGFGARHRHAARLDRTPARPRRVARPGLGRQLRRLHEPGGGDPLCRPDRRRDRRRRHLQLRHVPAEHRELSARPAPRRVR